MNNMLQSDPDNRDTLFSHNPRVGIYGKPADANAEPIENNWEKYGNQFQDDIAGNNASLEEQVLKSRSFISFSQLKGAKKISEQVLGNMQESNEGNALKSHLELDLVYNDNAKRQSIAMEEFFENLKQ
jgi:hypothetical protein